VDPSGWEWDETLYAGSAEYYERGRLPYPAGLDEVAAAALGLDGTGRLVDVGCGPGIVARRLARLFASVVGVDADRAMVEQATRRAAEVGVANARWVHMRAEELPADLGRFRIATFAQSFHWLDRPRVAAAVRSMLEPGGALVHVHNWSMVGDPVPEAAHPLPPYDDAERLVRRYLGPVRRAGQGVLPNGTPDDEAAVFAAAGFEPGERVPVPGGAVATSSVDDLIARCFSASGSAPHLFGSRRDAFEADLAALLSDTSPSGEFAERVRDAALVIWRAPRGPRS
jgi:SAM-dependent methyltransferase